MNNEGDDDDDDDDDGIATNIKHAELGRRRWRRCQRGTDAARRPARTAAGSTRAAKEVDEILRIAERQRVAGARADGAFRGELGPDVVGWRVGRHSSGDRHTHTHTHLSLIHI